MTEGSSFKTFWVAPSDILPTFPNAGYGNPMNLRSIDIIENQLLPETFQEMVVILNDNNKIDLKFYFAVMAD